MRCDECKVEPLTPGHFCECCGRKLSLQERKALDEKKAPEKASATSWGEPAPVLPKPRKGDRLVGVHYAPEPYVDDVSEAPAPYADPVPEAEIAQAPVDSDLEAHFAAHFSDAPAPDVAPATRVAIDSTLEAHFAGQAAPPLHLDSDAPSARCESCGGPAVDGNLCPSCQQAFHAVLDSPNSAPPAGAVETVAPAREVAVTPVVPVASEVPAAVSAAMAVHAESAPGASPAVSTAATPVSPVAQVSAAPAPPQVAAAEMAPAPVKSAIRVKTPPPPPDVAPVASVDPVPQAKGPKPVAPVAAAAVPPAQRTSPARTIAGAAAVIVVLAAIGFPLAKLWLGGQESSPIIREAQATTSAEPARAATPPGGPAPGATTAREESVVQTPPPAPTVPPAPPKAAPVSSTPSKAGVASSNLSRTAAARVPSRTGRQPVTPVRQTAAVAVPGPVVPAPAPEVAAPAPVAAAPAPAPEPPPAPVGPFFELRDVNETPRVATRVEPQVPDDLRDRPLNEVVIVRVLVTQTGHPLMINLLRKSKAGPSLDNAIVAAVKQWTFVPARRRGEAVSCWFHVGVPVSKAN